MQELGKSKETDRKAQGDQAKQAGGLSRFFQVYKVSWVCLSFLPSDCWEWNQCPSP